MEERATGTLSVEQRMINAVNADRALMRFEFLHLLSRLAIAKYVKGGKTTDASEAIEMFLEFVQGKVPPEARHTSDVFRRARLYCREVHTVLTAHEKSLRSIYEHYSLGSDAQGITMAGRRMSLDEWEELLDDTGIYDDAFHRRDGALCFIWAQPLVTDEVKRRVPLIHLSFIDFLEALARICTMKPLPTPEILKECHALTVPHWYQQAAEGKHAGNAMLRRVKWAEEEVSSASLAQPLEALIELLKERLDCNHDGVVTRTELKRYKAQRLRQPKSASHAAAAPGAAPAAATRESSRLGSPAPRRAPSSAAVATDDDDTPAALQVPFTTVKSLGRFGKVTTEVVPPSS